MSRALPPPIPAAVASGSMGTASSELADLQAYQASTEGMIARHLVDLLCITADLAKLAGVPSTRALIAAESSDLALAHGRLHSLLQLISNGVAS